MSRLNNEPLPRDWSMEKWNLVQQLFQGSEKTAIYNALHVAAIQYRAEETEKLMELFE